MLVKVLVASVIVLAGVTGTALLYLNAKAVENSAVVAKFEDSAEDRALALQTAVDCVTRGACIARKVD